MHMTQMRKGKDAEGKSNDCRCHMFSRWEEMHSSAHVEVSGVGVRETVNPLQ